MGGNDKWFFKETIETKLKLLTSWSNASVGKLLLKQPLKTKATR